MTHRSICLPDFRQFRTFAGTHSGTDRGDHSGYLYNTDGQRGVSGLRNKACSTTIRADFRQLYGSEAGLSLVPHLLDRLQLAYKETLKLMQAGEPLRYNQQEYGGPEN